MKIIKSNLIANNYMGTPLVPPSLIANTSSQQTLSILPNSNLSIGNPVNSPVFSNQLSQGLVSSSLVNGNDWIALNNQSVTFAYPSLMVWNNEFYQIPPCNLNVTTQNNTSVLYASKAKSGLNPIETQIGLVTLNDTVEPSEALELADGQITTVYIPLAVFNGDENGNQTLTWELDKNCQFSAPVLNQFVLLQDFEENAKQFLTNQFTALYNDLVSFANWQKSWDALNITCNFSQTNIENVVTPVNVAGTGISGVQYSINQLVVKPIQRMYSCNVVGLAWLQNCNDQSAYPGWNSNYGAPLIYTQERGGMEPQLNGLIPNFDSYTSTYYVAPSQDIGIPNALWTPNGNNGPSGGDPGYNKWQKTLVWSSADGNLYTHTGNPNVEYDMSNPVSWPLPQGVEIQLRDANTNETVLTWPSNPLFNPSFLTSYPA